MLKRNKFSITYPESSVKYTNLFKGVHDQVHVQMPSLNINHEDLVFPESINIHMFAERFLHLPFKGLLGDGSNFKKLTLDFTNKTGEFGTIYSEKFVGSKEAFEDQNCNFILMKPGERAFIPQDAIVVEKKPIRECAVRSLFVLGKTSFSGEIPSGPGHIPEGKVTLSMTSLGSNKPKDIFNVIMSRNEEILDEISEIFKSDWFNKKLVDNDNVCYLEGKYFPQLNVISDICPNLYIKLNTADDYNSNQYITLRVVTTDGFQEAVEKVRMNFRKLKLTEA